MADYTLTVQQQVPLGNAIQLNFGVAAPARTELTFTPSDNGAGGTFTPITVRMAGGAVKGRCVYTPAAAGVTMLSATNDAGLLDVAPAPLTVIASPEYRPALVLTWLALAGADGYDIFIDGYRWAGSPGTTAIFYPLRRRYDFLVQAYKELPGGGKNCTRVAMLYGYRLPLPWQSISPIVVALPAVN